MELPILRRFLQHVKLIALIILIQAAFVYSETNADDFDEELYSVIHSVRDGSLWSRSRHVRSLSEIQPPSNRTISDNSLWNDLMYECRKRTSFSCIKSGVFKYLDKSLEINHDVEITDSLLFRKNANKYNGYCENSEDGKDMCDRYNKEKLKILSDNKEENEINGDSDASKEENPQQDTEDEDITEGGADGRSFESFSDVSEVLYDKGTQFLMTHDLEFQLPQTYFGGGSVKIEPKAYEVEEGEDEEDEGTVVKIIFKPPPPTPAQKGRFLFHHLKKLFKKKLMHSFMALMLIIKMIKVKIMFLLPMIVGQSTAKRLLLKVLLFLIPGLAHLFKLCHYYHMEHAKYHHHHHKIKHHHHHVQVPVPVPVPVHHHHESLVHHHVEPSVHHVHEEPSFVGPHGPHGSSGPHDYPPYPSSSNHISSDQEYEYPPVGSQHGGGYNRGEVGSTLSQYNDNEAAMASWGMGSNNYLDVGALDAKDQPIYSGYEVDDKKVFKKSPYNTGQAGAQAIYQNTMGGISSNIAYPTKLPILTPRPPYGVTTVPVSYDPFYSPILQKIDNIFVQLGFNEEACRERLVCSMYKNPHRFSPHSNLISAELSRDARELQKPINNNSAVVRFYRYVQAARDGQDQKDCLRLYARCTVNTEKK